MVGPRRLLTPPELLALAPPEADDLLDHLERHVPVRPPCVEVPARIADEAIVFGDTHGDWRSSRDAVLRYREGNRCLIGLGDYVDRAPEDCIDGSVVNALYLLSLAAESPDRVYLIEGNHETVRRIPAVPHNLPEEVDDLWGPDSTRYDRLLGLFERGPLAVTTSNGAYLAHAGFPRGRLPSPWPAAFASLDVDGLAEIVWTECDASRVRRGAAPPWGERELDRFLGATGLRIVLRGHDPDLTGRPLYRSRCLTLHTSRIYERYGGVIIARLPLGVPLRTVADVSVEHLSTEGKTFPTLE
jgi:Calcineurin-like phosphoesterase